MNEEARFQSQKFLFFFFTYVHTCTCSCVYMVYVQGFTPWQLVHNNIEYDFEPHTDSKNMLAQICQKKLHEHTFGQWQEPETHVATITWLSTPSCPMDKKNSTICQWAANITILAQTTKSSRICSIPVCIQTATHVLFSSLGSLASITMKMIFTCTCIYLSCCMLNEKGYATLHATRNDCIKANSCPSLLNHLF